MGKRIIAALLAASTLLLSGCNPDPAPRQVCPASGCLVPRDEDPQAVPLCVDASGTGPCVGRLDTGAWLFVAQRATWPHGRTLPLCPAEDGGPVPCAWVPSVQGNETGDAGALVYGVKS